jgi:soluble P-type ATPase
MTKEKHIGFRVTDEEYGTIKAKAEKSRMSISRYVLSAALEKEIVVIEELKEFARQLGKVGNNLNQAVILLRQRHIDHLNVDGVKKVVDNIWRLLTSLTGRTKR